MTHTVEGPAFSGCINQKMRLEMRKFSKLMVHSMLNVRSKGSQRNIAQAKQNGLGVTLCLTTQRQSPQTQSRRSVEKTM